MKIFLYCFLTVLIETPFLMAFGYRRKYETAIIICANVFTNLTLNVSIALCPVLYDFIYLPEALVAAAEYFIYAKAFGRSKKLFFLTLAANVLSYTLGLLFFR